MNHYILINKNDTKIVLEIPLINDKEIFQISELLINNIRHTNDLQNSIDELLKTEDILIQNIGIVVSEINLSYPL